MPLNAGPPASASPPQSWRVWSALGAVYVIWGSTYLAIRLMVETLPPALGSGLRFAVAGAVMLVLLAARRDGWRAIAVSAAQMRGCAAVGTLLAAGGNGLVTVAEQDVPSGLAALLIASVPLWIVLYRRLARDPIPRSTLGGVAFGFAGVAVLLAPGGRPSGVPIGMALLLVIAAASWAGGSFLSRRVALPGDTLLATGWQMLWGGLVTAAAGLTTGEASGVHARDFSVTSVGAFAYLVVVGSIVAFSCYAYLLRNAPISQVSTYAFVNPVIAVALGAVVLGESVTAATVGGMALVVVSVAVTVRQEGRRAQAAKTPASPARSGEETERSAA